MKALSFDDVAAKVRWWYAQEHLSHQQIADRLIAEGIAPALGHEGGTWRSVDSVLVLDRSRRQQTIATEPRGSGAESTDL